MEAIIGLFIFFYVCFKLFEHIKVDYDIQMRAEERYRKKGGNGEPTLEEMRDRDISTIVNRMK